MLLFFFFFFSSRRRHTRCSRDWSSDVCSSDLPRLLGRPRRRGRRDDRVGRRGGLGERVIECGGAARDAAHAEPRVRVPRGDRVQRGGVTCFPGGGQPRGCRAAPSGPPGTPPPPLGHRARPPPPPPPPAVLV